MREPKLYFHRDHYLSPAGRLLREIIFGANDGLVTTLGFVAGATRSIHDPVILLIATFGAVAAGAVSLGLGAYVSSQSQRRYFERELAEEEEEIEELPEKELNAVRRMFRKMGFTQEEVSLIARRVQKDKRLWLRLLAEYQLGISYEQLPHPVQIGVIIGFSFIVGALPPLVPFIVTGGAATALLWAIIASILALFGLGAVRSYFTKERLLYTGLEMVTMGGIAAAIGYIIGKFLGPSV